MREHRKTVRTVVKVKRQHASLHAAREGPFNSALFLKNPNSSLIMREYQANSNGKVVSKIPDQNSLESSTHC